MEEDVRQSQSLPWRRRLVFLLLIVVAASVIGRMTLASNAEEQTASATSAPPPGGTTLMPRQPTEPGTEETAAPEEEGWATRLLPFLTEGGIAMLLGIALGVASRAVAKLAIIFIAVIFIVLQVLAYQHIITIDWGAFATWLHDFVLNISSDTGIGGIVRHKLPSAGALAVGYMLGLKRG